MKKTVLTLLALFGLFVPLALVQITSNAVAQIGGGVYGGPVNAPGGTFTAPVFFPDGTAAAPSYSWSAEPGFGWWRSGAGSMYLTQAGVSRLRISNSTIGVASDGIVRWNNGTNMAAGAVDTGLSRISAGVLGLGNGTGSTFGSALQLTSILLAKVTQTNTAPGAGLMKFEVVAGTVGGSCRLIVYAGTSTTPTTVIDSVGSGC